MICAVASIVVFYLMVIRVNERLPASEQMIVVWPGQRQWLVRQYRNFYPHGRLHLLRWALQVIMIIAATSAVALVVHANRSAISGQAGQSCYYYSPVFCVGQEDL